MTTTSTNFEGLDEKYMAVVAKLLTFKVKNELLFTYTRLNCVNPRDFYSYILSTAKYDLYNMLDLCDKIRDDRFDKIRELISTILVIVIEGGCSVVEYKILLQTELSTRLEVLQDLENYFDNYLKHKVIHCKWDYRIK